MLDPKQIHIIKAAVNVFADKGFKTATISDLAQEAGVGEATIYNHFKNKEKILLSIPEPFIFDFLAHHDDHQTGIRDPEERLRRFIWLYLWWSQKNRDFIRVFLLEIQPHPHYYHSQAYKLFGRLRHMTSGILEFGRDEGLFVDDIPTDFINCFLLGTIHYLFFTRIMFDRGFDVLQDFDELAGLMISAIKRNDSVSAAETDSEDKRLRILMAAENLFSSKNVGDTRISEIAGLAKVADGTIYDYFQNKEDLLFNLFDRRMEGFSKTFRETLCPHRPENKLRHGLWHLLTWAQNNRSWARIYFKDIIPNPRFYQSDHYRSMRIFDDDLLAILEEGRSAGVFRRSMAAHYFRAMVMGTMDQLCSPWAILGHDMGLVEVLDGFHSLVINAVREANGAG